ncbi:unnamed protein product, partial [Discosporangium mesarthrocarpum]
KRVVLHLQGVGFRPTQTVLGCDVFHGFYGVICDRTEVPSPSQPSTLRWSQGVKTHCSARVSAGGPWAGGQVGEASLSLLERRKGTSKYGSEGLCTLNLRGTSCTILQSTYGLGFTTCKSRGTENGACDRVLRVPGQQGPQPMALRLPPPYHPYDQGRSGPVEIVKVGAEVATVDG